MKFHIGDVLSIVTSRLVASTGMEAVYKLLNHMTGESLFTHQLPRAANECRPWLLRQFPGLAGVEYPDGMKPDGIATWVDEQARIHGEELDVQPMPPGENGPRDPVQELVEKIGKDRVIILNPGHDTIT